MKLNENILNSIPDGQSKRAYLQGFDYETITLKNITEITETIYKGSVEPSYQKKGTSEYVNSASISRKMRGGTALSKSYSETTSKGMQIV